MKSKVVYLAHAVEGDVPGNIKKILHLCRKIHLQNENIIPIAPYIVSLQYLDDGNADERELGISADELYFERKMLDELWLCGEKISTGMKIEIEWAKKYNIPIVYHSPELRSMYGAELV